MSPNAAEQARQAAHLAGFVRGYMAARGFGVAHAGQPDQWPYWGFGVTEGQAWARKTPTEIEQWRDASNWYRATDGTYRRK